MLQLEHSEAPSPLAAVTTALVRYRRPGRSVHLVAEMPQQQGWDDVPERPEVFEQD